MLRAGNRTEAGVRPRGVVSAGGLHPLPNTIRARIGYLPLLRDRWAADLESLECQHDLAGPSVSFSI